MSSTEAEGKSLPVHSGTLNASAIHLARIFFADPVRKGMDSRFHDKYVWKPDSADTTMDVAGIDATLANRDSMVRPTLYAGVKGLTTFGDRRRVRDTPTKGGTTFTTMAETYLVFRLETFAPDDGRWVLGAFQDFLFAMADPFIQDFGGEGGQISDFKLMQMEGPVRVGGPSQDNNANSIWRTEITVRIWYHMTITTYLETLPLREIEIRTNSVD